MASLPKVAKQQKKKKKKRESSFTENELQVAEILLDLQETSRSPPFLFWGSKKKRSCTNYPTSSPCNGEKSVVFKVDASSPATPLSFSPSDIESKPEQSRRVRRRAFKKKKSNEQLRELVAELISQQEQLKYEISKVSDYYEKLRAVNLQLKARQLTLFLLRKKDQFDVNSCKSLNVHGERTQLPHPFLEEKQAPIIHQPSEPPAEEEKAPIIIRQQSAVNATTIVGNFGYPRGKMSLVSDSGLSLQSNCPYPVVGMNLLADEAARRDFHCRAAMAARARKRRIEINRVKNSMALKQPRFG